MVTRTSQKAHRLPWDAFTANDNPARQHIEQFRVNEWNHIRHQLRQEFGVEIPDAEEPHWAEPGAAVYWRNTVNRRRILDEETGNYTLEVKETGWRPTKPLPANNASQINHFLQNGLRLRPPSDGEVDVDEGVLEAARPAEAVQPKPEHIYHCKRHEVGDFKAHTWEQYRQHCVHHKETLQEKPPERVLQAMTTFRWYCIYHAVGMDKKRSATTHVDFYRKQMGQAHAPISALENKKAKEGDGNAILDNSVPG